MNRSILCAGVLLLAASGATWAEDKAATPEQQWQQHITEMRQLHQNWMAGKTPEERQKLMEQHWQAMGRGMQNMGGCMAGGQGMGMNKGMGMGMGGGWMRMDTVEQVDLRIQHMEQMIEQLRAHREMLAKP
ncbi:hypothetical protein [Pseudomonas oryzae]|uniref:Zinc resistance-associated protein n=1 Tax=Pseudomonas oryzae TaxID=1392877 RepID=A0A1H1RS50_9PSED|nr:hypothetical protein [Pseudomonas oryzae]SDS38492.1 hypothetical protein SAMN05216221_1703 [Pseudomonas oryzae]